LGSVSDQPNDLQEWKRLLEFAFVSKPEREKQATFPLEGSGTDRGVSVRRSITPVSSIDAGLSHKPIQ